MGGQRLAGVTLPLSALRSTRDAGIGEIGDLEAFLEWAASAGQGIVALLPLGELAPGETSPYNALSTFAIDPLYVTPSAIPELVGVPEAEPSGGADRLDRERVREWKEPLLREAWRRFSALPEGCARRRGHESFLRENRDWIGDHALFRALYEEHGRVWWREWPAPLRDRQPRAVSRARAALRGEVDFHAWLQFAAEEQWWRAREHARRAGVLLMGDLPFGPSGNSADVWAHPEIFDLGRSVGAPPDEFSETGQRWGLPMYRWDAMRAGGWTWFRRRFRRMSALCDLYRIDHVVGLFRTFAFADETGPGEFDPADEPAQIAQGREILELALAESGAGSVVAEDLGLIPDWVREVMLELDVPGYKVFRWERDEGSGYVDPRKYPECSIATFGTHDNEPLALWWSLLERPERAEVLALLGDTGEAEGGLSTGRRRALLDLLYRSGSRYVILPVQDLFGWTDRINLPATVGAANWTWRLPIPVERLGREPEGSPEVGWLRTSIDAAGRLRRMRSFGS